MPKQHVSTPRQPRSRSPPLTERRRVPRALGARARGAAARVDAAAAAAERSIGPNNAGKLTSDLLLGYRTRPSCATKSCSRTPRNCAASSSACSVDEPPIEIGCGSMPSSATAQRASRASTCTGSPTAIRPGRRCPLGYTNTTRSSAIHTCRAARTCFTTRRVLMVTDVIHDLSTGGADLRRGELVARLPSAGCERAAPRARSCRSAGCASAYATSRGPVRRPRHARHAPARRRAHRRASRPGRRRHRDDRGRTARAQRARWQLRLRWVGVRRAPTRRAQGGPVHGDRPGDRALGARPGEADAVTRYDAARPCPRRRCTAPGRPGDPRPGGAHRGLDDHRRARSRPLPASGHSFTASTSPRAGSRQPPSSGRWPTTQVQRSSARSAWLAVQR